MKENFIIFLRLEHVGYHKENHVSVWIFYSNIIWSGDGVELVYICLSTLPWDYILDYILFH